MCIYAVAHWKKLLIDITWFLFMMYNIFYGSDGIESACIAWDSGSVPGSERSPGEGNGDPLQSVCLENPMERRAREATAHGIAKSWTWLSN